MKVLVTEMLTQVFNMFFVVGWPYRPTMFMPLTHEQTLMSSSDRVAALTDVKDKLPNKKVLTGTLLACNRRGQRDCDMVDGSHMGHHRI